MKKILTIIVIAVFGMMGLESLAQTVVYKGDFDHRRLKNMKKCIRKYQKAYHCLDSLVVIDSSMSTLEADMHTTAYSAQAVPGGTVLVNRNVHKGRRLFRGEFSHELGHAIAPADSTPIRPFTWLGLYTCYAFRGLTILAKDNDSGSHFPLIIFDEAMAHTLGARFSDSKENKKYPGYWRITNLTESMIINKWLSTQDLINFQKHSDVSAFVGKVLNKRKGDVTGNDVGLVLNWYFAYFFEKTDSMHTFDDLIDAERKKH